MNATLIVTTASNATVQIPTLPARLDTSNREINESIQWAERLMSAHKSSDKDAARFLAGLFA